MRESGFGIAAAGWVLAASLALSSSLSTAAAESTADRGAYLASIMDCGGCHTTGALVGAPDQAMYLAGSAVGFQIPGLGTFYPPNLTSDPETGLGAWSEEEIAAAVRTGERPDGRMLVPVMPWPSYSALTDEDAQALAAYIKSLPPVVNKVPGPFGDSETPTAAYLATVIP